MMFLLKLPLMVEEQPPAPLGSVGPREKGWVGRGVSTRRMRNSCERRKCWSPESWLHEGETAREVLQGRKLWADLGTRQTAA